MANSTVAAMTAASALDGTELWYTVQGGADRKATGAQIKTWTSASPSLVTPALGTPSSGTLTNCTGLLATGGGTGQSTYTKGDILASPGSNTLNKLGVGTDTFVLTADAASTNGIKWAASGAGGLSNFSSDGTTLSGSAQTITTSAPVLSLTQTWNAAATFTGILLNVTGTSYSAESQLLNLQIGGNAFFQIGSRAANSSSVNNAYAQIGNVVLMTLFNGDFIVANSFTPASGGTLFVQSAVGVQVPTSYYYGWSSNGSDITAAVDTLLTRGAAATLQQGAADAAAPVAQTTRVQSVVAGTTNTAGANWTISGSKGTGTGAGGQVIFQTAPAGTTGTSQNALAAALTFTAPAVNMQPSAVLGNAAIATNATDGFIYVVTCAGTPTGTPTTFTGRVPMVFDTSASQFWIFTGGSWKQPKTPAGAAIVTWQ